MKTQKHIQNDFLAENEDGEEDGEDSESRDEPPRDYLCPVTCVLMKDPVCAADGFTYERKAIEKLKCIPGAKKVESAAEKAKRKLEEEKEKLKRKLGIGGYRF